ncbi:MAG TPA: molybdopterin-dependent oxidoreductase [Gemmatimonadales bacterium]|jgi:DMSO/TMAO reductase YedYZ molybdopterin-dependent catalytic subunit
MAEPRRIITRRDFIQVATPVLPLALSACGWDGGKRMQPLFDKVIGFNNTLGEELLAVRHASVNPRQLSRGQMPAYYIAKAMPQLADSASWQLDVGGLVRKPTKLSLPMLAALPHIGYTVTHHCVEGWSVVKSWNGVPFATLAALVEPLPTARYVRFDSFDDGYMNGWDMASAMHPQTILADAFEGQPLTADHGAPLRLYSPIKLGYKLTKYLTRVTFTAEKPGGYWEDMGYPWFGGL